MTEIDEFNQTMRITIPLEADSPAKKAGKLSPKIKRVSKEDLRSKLGDSEYKLYSDFMRSIYDAVIITEINGYVMDVNARSVEYFRYEIQNFHGINIFQIVRGFDKSVLKTITTNLGNDRFTLIEAYCVRSDNTLFPADIAVSKLYLGGKEHLCFFVRDSTRRKEYEQILQKTQAHLVRAERLEMAGSIAGRIAHDFNNLLTPLMAYPELIKKKLPEDSQAREDLEIIEKTAKQIADINQQLLVLSRRGHYEQKVLNINLVIQDVVSLIRRGTYPEGIEIELNLSDDLFNTRGASEQLLRVIQNLCQNAVDAMGETGTLIIKTENVQLDASLKHYEAVPPGEYIKIMISDTGCGIPAEIMNRIFEPFFTTTKTNHQRGSGLGLSVVHGVIKDHNGYIDLDSEVGRGTAFTLYLPSCHESMKEDTSKIEQPGGAETILIVDDDPMQVKVISRIVRELGYTPLKAQSGEEAVSIVEQVKASENLPDLAVLDMIMGDGIDGAETYERLKEINPRQRAIFLSGYAESAKVAQAQTHGTGVFLKKPIPIKALGKAIREELDRA